MTKEEMDIKLIEACLLEKWIPMSQGRTWIEDRREFGQDSIGSCSLCQVYYKHRHESIESCTGCPIRERPGGRKYCERTPIMMWAESFEEDEQAFAEEEVEFLISLLPKDHPWRK